MTLVERLRAGFEETVGWHVDDIREAADRIEQLERQVAYRDSVILCSIGLRTNWPAMGIGGEMSDYFTTPSGERITVDDDEGEMTLVERLREAARWTPTYSDAISEAADRIERLEEAALLWEGEVYRLEAALREIEAKSDDPKIEAIAHRALEGLKNV